MRETVAVSGAFCANMVEVERMTAALDYNKLVITSTKNSKIKALRALQNQAKERKKSASFVIEGVRLAEEAVAADWPVRSGIYTEALSARGQAILNQLIQAGANLEAVSAQVMKAASDTQTPQGILLELDAQELALVEAVDFVLIADEVRDPGNLGSLLRSAAAAGVDAVLLSPGCADAFSPKVLRSGMGAHFQIAMRKLRWDEIGVFSREHRLEVLLAAAGEGRAYDQEDLSKPLAIILGGEAQGAGEEARALAGDILHIPMPGKMESLNAATAGSLFLFEALRQRKAKAK